MSYRESIWKKDLPIKVTENKELLAGDIDKRTKKKGKHYLILSKKSSSYYRQFENIYNFKCAYCGTNTAIQPTEMFELDHFITKTKENLPNGNSVHNISNLIFSCRKCNRSKGDLDILTYTEFCVCSEVNCEECLNPDNQELDKIYKRNSKYEIVISPDYEKCSNIKEFYEKLDFSNKLRKLDYLLLNILHARSVIKNDNVKKSLSNLYIDLHTLRNSKYF